jgi:hypothetical protein
MLRMSYGGYPCFKPPLRFKDVDGKEPKVREATCLAMTGEVL